jgi:hypothetical protein
VPEIGENKAMEPVPSWLDAAISAAGMTTVYIAEDWNPDFARNAALEPVLPLKELEITLD